MLRRIRNKVSHVIEMASKLSVSVRRNHYEEIKRQRFEKSPKVLNAYGYKVFSQSDEDGIINQIFKRVGVTNRIFVEFGVGNGLENNTVALLYEGWTGLWIESSSGLCKDINNIFGDTIETGQLHLKNQMVTPENINDLISSVLPTGSEIDLLSVDIDGNDVHVYKQITCVNPRVIVFEYNAKFGPSIDYCMAYDPTYSWKKSDRFGASLKHFERVMNPKGYSCVGCNIAGTNSFFVRKDLLGDKFLEPFSSEEHFEPARYELTGLPSGHLSSYETFRTRERLS